MGTRVYPVTPIDLPCTDYRVWVDGTEAALNTARVSAVPFNRRWPGHQRGLEQTEIIQFLSLETSGEVRFSVKPSFAYDPAKLNIRPKSLGIRPEIASDGTISFSLNRPAYFTVEPCGRNRALHIFADPMAEYAADLNDPAVLYYGPGEHDAGTIVLHSGQTLFLDEGAVVYACVRAMDADNIRILGRGILDNSRNREKILFEANAENNDSAVNNAIREHTVQLEYCTGVLIDGITIRDSLVYNIRPIGCADLEIRNVKIIGCWRYNSDGIDMHNCLNVHIDNCFLRTFDDSICVKGFDCYYSGDVEQAVHAAMYRNGKAYDVFRNVLVERCTIWNDWGKCLEIGAETRAEEIADILFRDCDLIHLTGQPMDCMNVDYADVHDVVFRDIRIEADEMIPAPAIQGSDDQTYANPNPDYMPATFTSMVVFHHEYSAGGNRRGKNRNFTLEDIRLYGPHRPTVTCSGYDAEHLSENILLRRWIWNDRPIVSADEINLQVGSFTENIRWESE